MNTVSYNLWVEFKQTELIEGGLMAAGPSGWENGEMLVKGIDTNFLLFKF